MLDFRKYYFKKILYIYSIILLDEAYIDFKTFPNEFKRICGVATARS